MVAWQRPKRLSIGDQSLNGNGKGGGWPSATSAATAREPWMQSTLLNHHDPAAQRTRAFVQRWSGTRQARGRRQSVMPGGSARFAPFFRYLPHLIFGKTTAVHLGIFPDNCGKGSGQPVGPAGAGGCGVRRQRPRGGPQPLMPARRQASAISKPPVRMATREPTPTAETGFPCRRKWSASPSLACRRQAAPRRRKPRWRRLSQLRRARAGSRSRRRSSARDDQAEAGGGNLSGIDKLLATIAEAPPPPRGWLEKQSAGFTTAPADEGCRQEGGRQEGSRQEGSGRERRGGLAAEEGEEEAASWVSRYLLVQLAGGSSQDRMATEYKAVRTGRQATQVAFRLCHRGQGLFPAYRGPFGARTTRPRSLRGRSPRDRRRRRGPKLFPIDRRGPVTIPRQGLRRG